MPNDLEVMGMQVKALFTCDSSGNLLNVNEPDSKTAPAPRLFLGRTRAGNLWRFRADLPKDLVAELDALCAEEPPLAEDIQEPPRHVERYLRLLERHAAVQGIEAGPAYRFPAEFQSGNAVVITEDNAELLRGSFEKLLEEVPAWQPFIVVLHGGRVASACRSVRITSEAHEAGVETLPEFRGQGLAGEAAALWAERVRALGALPLYSTSWENRASQAVARKLNLEFYGSDFHIT